MPAIRVRVLKQAVRVGPWVDVRAARRLKRKVLSPFPKIFRAVIMTM